MSTKENKALVRRCIEETWVKGNVAAVNEFMAPDKVVAIRPPLGPHPRKPRGPGNGCSGHHYRFIRWYSRGVPA